MNKEREQINEMERIVYAAMPSYCSNELLRDCKNFESCVVCRLWNAGYRKQVWHKVAEGDLPKKDTQYLCIIKVADFKFYKILGFDNNKFYMYDNEYGEFIEVNEVIVWTELPDFYGFYYKG